MLGIAFRKGFDNLLRRPFGSRMFSYAKVMTLRRRGSIMRKTNNTRNRIVGTVKKSTAMISPT